MLYFYIGKEIMEMNMRDHKKAEEAQQKVS